MCPFPTYCRSRACEVRAFRSVAAPGAAGFVGGERSLVEGHLAGRTDIDIDAPALALRSLLIFPIMEMIGRGDDHDIAPAFLQIGRAARRDGLVLRGPEGISIGEIAVVAEQVGEIGRAHV